MFHVKTVRFDASLQFLLNKHSSEEFIYLRILFISSSIWRHSCRDVLGHCLTPISSVPFAIMFIDKTIVSVSEHDVADEPIWSRSKKSVLLFTRDVHEVPKRSVLIFLHPMLPVQLLLSSMPMKRLSWPVHLFFYSSVNASVFPILEWLQSRNLIAFSRFCGSSYSPRLWLDAQCSLHKIEASLYLYTRATSTMRALT